MTTRVYKANPFPGKKVETQVIRIEMRQGETTHLELSEYCGRLEDDARRIVYALEAGLPGGTLDRLTAMLMRRWADRCGYSRRVKHQRRPKR